MAGQNALVDQNQTTGLIAVQGTAGTADTLGTSPLGRVGMNPDNGALFVQDLAGAAGTTNVQVLPLSGVILTTAVTVGITATAIPATPLAARKTISVYNDGTATIFLGGSGVTVTGSPRGIPVEINNYAAATDVGTTVLYAIGATDGGTAVVMEIS